MRWVHVTLLAPAGSQTTATGGLGRAQSKAKMETTPGGITRQESWKPHPCAGSVFMGKTRRGEGPSALTKERRQPCLFPLNTAFIRKAGQSSRRSLAKCSKGETEHSRAAGEICTSMTFRVSQKTDKFQIQAESHKRHQWLCDVTLC